MQILFRYNANIILFRFRKFFTCNDLRREYISIILLGMSDHLRAAAELLVKMRDQSQAIVRDINALLAAMEGEDIQPPDSAILLLNAGKCLSCEKKISIRPKGKTRGCHWDCYQAMYQQFKNNPEAEREFLRLGKLVTREFLRDFRKSERIRALGGSLSKQPRKSLAQESAEARAKDESREGE